MTFTRVDKSFKTRGTNDKRSRYNKNVTKLEFKKLDRMKNVKRTSFFELEGSEAEIELECWHCGITIEEHLLCKQCREDLVN